MQTKHTSGASSLIDAFFFLAFAIFLIGGWTFHTFIYWPPSIFLVLSTATGVIGALIDIFIHKTSNINVQQDQYLQLKNTTTLDKIVQALVPFGAVIGMGIVIILQGVFGYHVRDLVGIALYPGIICTQSSIKALNTYLARDSPQKHTEKDES